ncbi:hypothetical protein ACWC10_16385 [Streptomyces sp. NPDC001595]|uniref:hypothetical protein n=1 Tax=Streptomyces sp. NPDC001532 TaxID=3154520 RepID=UPI0033182BCF
MSDDRRMRAEFCSALPWLMEDMTAEGTLAGLHDAIRAVLAETPVRQAVAALDIPPYVFDEAGPVRGDEHGAMVFGTTARSAGESYRCPDGWCSLNVVRTPGGELPAGGRCWLRDRPLRVVEA